jgi:hypothetical protein
MLLSIGWEEKRLPNSRRRNIGNPLDKTPSFAYAFLEWRKYTLRLEEIQEHIMIESEQQHTQHKELMPIRLDKTAFSVISSFAESDRDDDGYWWAQSAEARLRHIEFLRQINYGHHATARLQRVFEVVQRP